jgi:hypothetical protein
VVIDFLGADGVELIAGNQLHFIVFLFGLL